MNSLFEYIKFELRRFFKNIKLVIIFLISPLLATAVFALFAYQSPKDIHIGLTTNNDQLSLSIAEEIKSNSLFIVSDTSSLEDGKKMLKEGSAKTIISVDIANNKGVVKIIEDPRYPEVQGKVKEEITKSIKNIIAKAIADIAQETAEEEYKKTIDEKFVQFTDEILGQNSNTPLSRTINNELEKIKSETLAEIELQINLAVSDNIEQTKQNLNIVLSQKINEEFDKFSSSVLTSLPAGEVSETISKQFADYKLELIKAIETTISQEISQEMLLFKQNSKKRLSDTVNNKFAIYKNRLSPSNPESPIYLAIKEQVDKFKSDLVNEQIEIAINTEPIKLENKEFLSKEINYFDRYSSGAIPLVIVLIFLLKAATSLSQDRESGVLERLFSTPASRLKVMVAKIISNVLIGIFSLVAIILMLKFAFGAAIGSWWLVLLISFIMAIVSVSMGLLISVITRDLPSSIQFAFYTFFLMVLTSEFFFASENIHPYFRYASKINPLTYAISALRKVNLFDWGIFDIWPELVIMTIFAIVYTITAVFWVNRENR